MSFIEKMKEQAKKNIKTIALPEANDIRTLEAVDIVLKEAFANVILIGNKEKTLELAKTKDLNIANATFIEPAKASEYEDYVKKFYELRKEKGMTIEKAKELLLDPVYFGMMMVKLRKSRWFSLWSLSFNSRYTSSSSSNIKNSNWNETCILFFYNVCS